jgi:hypothetical protein
MDQIEAISLTVKLLNVIQLIKQGHTKKAIGELEAVRSGLGVRLPNLDPHRFNGVPGQPCDECGFLREGATHDRF